MNLNSQESVQSLVGTLRKGALFPSGLLNRKAVAPKLLRTPPEEETKTGPQNQAVRKIPDIITCEAGLRDTFSGF